MAGVIRTLPMNREKTRVAMPMLNICPTMRMVAQGRRGYAVVFCINRAHDGVCVRGGKKGEAESHQHQGGHDETQAALGLQPDKQKQAGGGNPHAQRSHQPGFQPVGKLPGQRRKGSHDHRLGDEHQSGRTGIESLDVLQVEAQQEGDGEGGAVINQRRQVGKGKNRIAADQASLKNWMVVMGFPVHEQGHGSGRGQKQHQPFPARQPGEAEHEGGQHQGVGQGPFPIKWFTTGSGPFLGHFQPDRNQDQHSQRNIQQKYIAPA